MATYEVTKQGLELPRGKRLTPIESPVAAGDLCVCVIGKVKVLGRWVPGWIIQPGRWIRITGDVIVKTLGRPN